MDELAKASPAERAAVFTEAAARMGTLTNAIVEKDFWVCWCLARLFPNNMLPKPMFKGGTSLSKAFGLIQRFSEDVDIVLDRNELGFGEASDPLLAEGAKKRKRQLEELGKRCSEAVRGEVREVLGATIEGVLGDSGWRLGLDQSDASGQSLRFEYPLGLPPENYGVNSYVRPVVRLEFGCRGETWPAQWREIRPYAAEFVPEIFRVGLVRVWTLRSERTFWEKVTLLHAVAHSRKVPARLSRHYYDVSRMLRSEVGTRAAKDIDLLAQVVKHKQVFFREAAARYELAVPGSLTLSPPAELEQALREDYREMSEMIFGQAPSFEEVLGDIRAFEQVVNREMRSAHG